MPEEVKKETVSTQGKAEETKQAAEKPIEKSADKTGVKPLAPEKTAAKNCVQCNKPIKKKSGYYRNSKYYCNKRCFKISRAKATAAAT
jgi:hypothetical protein